MGTTIWMLVLSISHFDNRTQIPFVSHSSNVSSYYSQSACQEASLTLKNTFADSCTQGKKSCTYVQTVCIEKQV